MRICACCENELPDGAFVNFGDVPASSWCTECNAQWDQDMLAEKLYPQERPDYWIGLDSRIVFDKKAKKAVSSMARKWDFEHQTRGMDTGETREDFEQELNALWCECCIRNEGKDIRYITNDFMIRGVTELKKKTRDYFRTAHGGDEGNTESFSPEFYEFQKMYKEETIAKMAKHYGVNEKTVRQYAYDNFVTKIPINPEEYLINHARLYGRDDHYWFMKGELYPLFESKTEENAVNM